MVPRMALTAPCWRAGPGRRPGAVVAEGEAVGEGEAEEVDEVLGEGGEVGESAFLDLAVFPVGFTEEVAGGLAGEAGGDVHCMTRLARSDLLLTCFY